MLIPHKGHTDTIQVYSVTVMTHVKAVVLLQAGHSSQGTSEPITPAFRVHHSANVKETATMNHRNRHSSVQSHIKSTFKCD